jgi:hypothetical protein
MTFAHGEFRVACRSTPLHGRARRGRQRGLHDAKTCTGCGHLNDVGAAHVVRYSAGWRSTPRRGGQNIGLQVRLREEHTPAQVGGGVRLMASTRRKVRAVNRSSSRDVGSCFWDAANDRFVTVSWICLQLSSFLMDFAKRNSCPSRCQAVSG